MRRIKITGLQLNVLKRSFKDNLEQLLNYHGKGHCNSNIVNKFKSTGLTCQYKEVKILFPTLYISPPKKQKVEVTIITQ